MKLFCNLLRPLSSRAGPIWRLNPSSGVHARRLYTPQLIRPSYAPVGSSPRLLQRRISSKRFNSSAASTLPSSATPSASSNSGRTTSAPQPSYEITFTCKLCKERSTHGISKQAYHKGSVLITCPLCKNRHVIADHLHMFSDTKTDIEEIMRRKGELVKKGTLGEGGDMEFWDDGSVTERTGPSRE